MICRAGILIILKKIDMALKALFLNCTLKKSPETSNTEAFIKQAEKVFKDLDVETESIQCC
jgi:hypothetical protein